MPSGQRERCRASGANAVRAVPMKQRVALGLGLGMLLMIGAASVGLDIKSRRDSASVDHSLGVLQKTSDLRLLLRSAESTARGFLLTNSASLRTEFEETARKIPPAVTDLQRAVDDNPVQLELLRDTAPLINHRLDISAEYVRLRAAGEF